MHSAHLDALQVATGASATPTAPVQAAPPLTPARLRRRELRAQGELARLAVAAESGALARVLASMSAGIAAAMAGRDRVAA